MPRQFPANKFAAALLLAIVFSVGCTSSAAVETAQPAEVEVAVEAPSSPAPVADSAPVEAPSSPAPADDVTPTDVDIVGTGNAFVRWEGGGSEGVKGPCTIRSDGDTIFVQFSSDQPFAASNFSVEQQFDGTPIAGSGMFVRKNINVVELTLMPQDLVYDGSPNFIAGGGTAVDQDGTEYVLNWTLFCS